MDQFALLRTVSTTPSLAIQHTGAHELIRFGRLANRRDPNRRDPIRRPNWGSLVSAGRVNPKNGLPNLDSTFSPNSLADRLSLLADADREFATKTGSAFVTSHCTNEEAALALMRSAAGAAFDLSKEPHFPALFAGCGTKVGQVIGATSPDGTEVTDRPVNAAELLATLCRILEVDGKSEFDSTSGKPIRDDGVMVPPQARTMLFDSAIKPIHELVR